MNFSGLIGNEETKRLVEDVFHTGRFPHALVIQGDKGTGKRTFAKLLAKALVCREKQGAPCGVCPSCIRAAAGSHPDIRIEEGSGATRSLSVDSIRTVIADAYRMPEEADVNVYLLFIENKISEVSQNKLLKIIEEPPANTVFIFTCKTAEIFLDTIRSRVQVFTLYPPKPEEAAGWFAENGGMDPEKAAELAALCGGNIGRMLEEDSEGTTEQAKSYAAAIAAAMTVTGTHEILKASAPLIKDRTLFREVLDKLVLIFRDACIAHGGGANLIGPAPAVSESLADLHMKRLAKLTGYTEEYKRKLDRNANMTLLVTGFCAGLREIAGK